MLPYARRKDEFNAMILNFPSLSFVPIPTPFSPCDDTIYRLAPVLLFPLNAFLPLEGVFCGPP